MWAVLTRPLFVPCLCGVLRPSSRTLSPELRARLLVETFAPVPLPAGTVAGYARPPLIMFGNGSFTTTKFLTMLGLGARIFLLSATPRLRFLMGFR
jgi:hypothetical protein